MYIPMQTDGLTVFVTTEGAFSALKVPEPFCIQLLPCVCQRSQQTCGGGTAVA